MPRYHRHPFLWLVLAGALLCPALSGADETLIDSSNHPQAPGSAGGAENQTPLAGEPAAPTPAPTPRKGSAHAKKKTKPAKKKAAKKHHKKHASQTY